MGTGIEVGWQIGLNFVVVSIWELNSPLRIDNCTKDGFHFLKGCSLEFLVDSSNPVVVRGVDVYGEIEWLLFGEELENVCIFAEFHSLAGSDGIIVVDNFFTLWVPVVNLVEEIGELSVDLVHLVVLVILGEFDNVFAKFALVVVFSEVFVDFLGVNSRNSGE